MCALKKNFPEKHPPEAFEKDKAGTEPAEEEKPAVPDGTEGPATIPEESPEDSGAWKSASPQPEETNDADPSEQEK